MKHQIEAGDDGSSEDSTDSTSVSSPALSEEDGAEACMGAVAVDPRPAEEYGVEQAIAHAGTSAEAALMGVEETVTGLTGSGRTEPTEQDMVHRRRVLVYAQGSREPAPAAAPVVQQKGAVPSPAQRARLSRPPSADAGGAGAPAGCTTQPPVVDGGEPIGAATGCVAVIMCGTYGTDVTGGGAIAILYPG